MLEGPPSEGSSFDVVKPNTNRQNNGVAIGETNGKNETWELENSMVRSWLLNSRQPEISKTYLL